MSKGKEQDGNSEDEESTEEQKDSSDTKEEIEPVEEPGEKPEKPDLQEPQRPVQSMYESQSVGRLYFNLTKKSSLSRWKKLSASAVKMPNLLVWWEMHEKYEKDLEKMDGAEDDEASLYKEVSSGVTKKAKKKKSKKKKNKKKEEIPEEKQDLWVRYCKRAKDYIDFDIIFD